MTDKKWTFGGVEFNVGDRVKVIGFAEDGQEDGMGDGFNWYNSWTPEMDNSIGREFEISEIRPEGAHFMEIEGEYIEGGYGYPLSVLQRVTK